MTNQIIVVEAEEAEEHMDLVTSMFPYILNNGELLIPMDCLDEVEDSGIPYRVSTIS